MKKLFSKIELLGVRKCGNRCKNMFETIFWGFHAEMIVLPPSSVLLHPNFLKFISITFETNDVER